MAATPSAAAATALAAEPPLAETLAIHEHRGTRAVQRMVEYAPSTGGLALWVQHRDDPDLLDSPVATDGHTLHYGPSFETLPLPEQVGLVAHELQQLTGDVDRQLFNICADAIVNSTLGHLGWLQLPKGAVMLDQLLQACLSLHQPVDVALLQWNVERLYRELDDRRDGKDRKAGRSGGQEPQDRGPAPREDGPRAARARSLGATAHADLRPRAGSSGSDDDAPERQAEQAREWNERLLRAHAGDGEFSMLRTLIADLPSTRTPWQQVLRTQLARALAPVPAPSWSRPARSYIANQGRAGPNRRRPWEPGWSGTKNVPRLVVMVDVSGSIGGPLMDRFAREIEALTRRLEAGLTLVIGDDQVRRVQAFEPGRSDLREIVFAGGGGTDFTPLLEEADRHRPDIGIVLTDLDGPTRFRPAWPVIWAVPEAFAAAVEPFGRKLVLN
jgi:hypothetical protein